MIKIYKYDPSSTWFKDVVNDSTLKGKKRDIAIEDAIKEHGAQISIVEYFKDWNRNSYCKDYCYACYGKVENSIERLVNAEINYDEGLTYLNARNNHPEDLIERRTSWGEMKDYADGLYWFINSIISDVVEDKIITPQVANEVEPKFKVGDWIVYNRNDSSREILYVYDIRDGRYYFNDNIHFSWSVKECDEKCHLWTIDDVKDGDVVAMEPFGTYEKPFVAIYKGRGLDHFVSYCFTSFDGKFNEGTGGHCLNVHPATKEQCDILFKAMDEARYTFDFDKKELKKIGQNTAWSEDDETKLTTAKTFIVNTSLVGNDEMKEATIDWVNGLKNRVQSKSEWSEEDETKLITAKTFIVNTSLVGNDGIKEATIEWLNDLKNRVQPKPAWSEEDERQFSIFIRHCYLKKNLYKKENNKEFAQKCQGLIDWLEAIKQRAELAVDNPNEKAIVKYLYEKKGYPIDLNGNLVSYEEAMESANRYINYKKEKFIEKACEWMKDNITYTHPRKGTEECVVNLEKFKDFMKGE